MKKENSKKTIVLKDKSSKKLKGLGTQLLNNPMYKNIQKMSENISNSLVWTKELSKIDRNEPILFTPTRNYQAEQLEELKEIKKNLNNNNALHLDYNNGNIFSFGKEIGKINKETKSGKMFVFLYENKGKLKSHKEIFKYVNGEGYKIEKTAQSSTSDWKRELPKNIKNLIENDKKGHYYIP